MSIFGSTPAGELMSGPADDALFSPAAAPVTRAFAVISGHTYNSAMRHHWIPKGTVVQIMELSQQDKTKSGVSAATSKAQRAGHNLKRLLCAQCPDDTIHEGYKQMLAPGIVGVLAEAVDVGSHAAKLHGGYIMVTLALENATEVHVPSYADIGKSDYSGGWTIKMTEKMPGNPLTLQARKDLGLFKVATVLSEWKTGDAMGIHACLHPQIFHANPTTPKYYEPEFEIGTATDRYAAGRLDTQAAMHL